MEQDVFKYKSRKSPQKKKGDSLRYFFQAFQKKKAAIITKTKPVMPLTSFGDNIMLAASTVVNMASPNKIAANIITRNPNIIYSVFMMSYFHRYHLIILWMDHVQPFPFCEGKFDVICLVILLAFAFPEVDQQTYASHNCNEN